MLVAVIGSTGTILRAAVAITSLAPEDAAIVVLDDAPPPFTYDCLAIQPVPVAVRRRPQARRAHPFNPVAKGTSRTYVWTSRLWCRSDWKPD